MELPEAIASARRDAALKALGISTEVARDILSVTITPHEVVVSHLVRTPNGKPAISGDHFLTGSVAIPFIKL